MVPAPVGQHAKAIDAEMAVRVDVQPAAAAGCVVFIEGQREKGHPVLRLARCHVAAHEARRAREAR